MGKLLEIVTKIRPTLINVARLQWTGLLLYADVGLSNVKQVRPGNWLV